LTKNSEDHRARSTYTIRKIRNHEKCKEEGFLTGVCYASTLPFISDTEEELDRMIKTAKEYGAEYAFVGSLTLYGKGPADCRTLIISFWIDTSQILYLNIKVYLRYFSSPQRV
jgi:hypothetical protein